MPRVSIVTPCHNAEPFVERMLESVRAQSFEDWEHVVVDDGSPDRTAEIVAGTAAVEPRLRLLRQSNAGAIAARNHGFAAATATSEYLLFLDADDVLHPRMLSTLISYLDSRAEVGMVFCEPIWVDAQDSVVTYGSPGARYVPTRFGVRKLPPDLAPTPFISLFFWGRISPSISLLRRSAYDRTGGWDPGQGYYAEDLDLWLKMALQADVHYLPTRLVRRRIHAQNHGSAAPVRAQERRLYDRWLSASWLTPEQRRMVSDAWRMRQGKLLPHIWFAWGTGHLRQGRVRRALTCYLRGAKRLAAFGVATARGRTPPGPVW